MTKAERAAIRAAVARGENPFPDSSPPLSPAELQDLNRQHARDARREEIRSVIITAIAVLSIAIGLPTIVVMSQALFR